MMSSKEDLIKSARLVMSSKGYSRTRVSDIVKKAGVAQGTFYLYFKSKENVLEEFISIIQSQQDALLANIKITNPETIREEFMRELMAVSTHFKEFYKENSDILKILMEELPHSNIVRFHSDNFRNNAKKIVEIFMKTGYKSGLLKDMNFDLVAEIISMSLKQLILLGSTNKLEHSVDEMFNTFIELCMFGIMKEDKRNNA